MKQNKGILVIKFQRILKNSNNINKFKIKIDTQFVKVRKLKSLRTQVPRVSKPKPAINIIKAASLYLVASEPLLSKKVSAAKEFT